MNEIIEELSSAMMPHTMFKIGGIPISDTIFTMWLIMALLIVAAYFVGKKLEMIPSKVQNVGEFLVESVNGIAKDTIGHHWRGYAPYIGTLLMFLAVSNIISIFNIIPSFFGYSLRPPTKDINVPSCMALMTILLVIGSSLRYRKPSGFIKSFFEPVPFLFPFKVIEYISKPLSLCLRLFGNILAAFCIMELIYFASKSFIKFIVPVVIPSIFSVYFDLFDGLLQAYIFAFLTALYVGEAIEEEH